MAGGLGGGFRPGGFGGMPGGFAGGYHPGGFGGLSPAMGSGMRPGGFAGGMPQIGGFAPGAAGARPNFPSAGAPLSAFGGGGSRPALLGGGPGAGGGFGGPAARFSGANPTSGDLNRFLGIAGGGGLPGGLQGGGVPALARTSATGFGGNRPAWLNSAGGAGAGVASRWNNAIRPGGPATDKISNWAQAHPDQMGDLAQRGDAARQRFDQAHPPGSDWWSRYHGAGKIPGSDWWSKYHPQLDHWYYQHDWHHHPWNYWWTAASWAGVGAWFGDGALYAPIYYSYGPQGNVEYVDNDVYVGGQNVGTAEEYAQSASELATVDPSTAQTTDADPQWLPLGTFAVFTKPDQTDPTRLLQLAVDKQGIISGSLHNAATDKDYVVQGRVDKQTQRVAMTIGAHSDVILETGLYNLTQPQTEALVHYGPQRTATYTLVRMNKPPDGDGQATPPAQQTSPATP